MSFCTYTVYYTKENNLMMNVLPEFSYKIFEEPNQLDLYQETIDNFPENWFSDYVSKEKFDKEYLSKIDNPELALEYCDKFDVKNNPEMENLIKNCPTSSYQYALRVLRGRFELGEPIIATSPEYSYHYAEEVLKDRFVLGEPIIATNPYCSYTYAYDILKGRFELGEKIIATDPKYSYFYAFLTLEGRFELGEPTIAKDPIYSLLYAINVLGGRFELAESIIIMEPEVSKKYIDFLKTEGIPIPEEFQ